MKILKERDMSGKKKLKILLTSPRGFCAGVDRAVKMVELALRKYGSPVYVRHEIVHNSYVVEKMKSKGAIFIDELSDIPDNSRPVIFSAHGVSKSIYKEAENRGFNVIDATCPLVGKVHREAERHGEEGKTVILIGHKNHPEVVGTMGHMPDGSAILIETLEDARNLPDDIKNPAWCSQTTLSVEETARIVEELEKRFPEIEGPIKEDICYATTNRQEAIREVAPMADALMVIGSPNSSNSVRLVEVAKSHGCPKSFLVPEISKIKWEETGDIEVLAISAGASAPEVLVEELITSAKEHFDIEVEEICIKKEETVFQIPKNLREG